MSRSHWSASRAIARSGIVALFIAATALGAEAQNQVVSGNQANSAVQHQPKTKNNQHNAPPAPVIQQTAQQTQDPGNLPDRQAGDNSKEDNGFWNGKFTDWAIVFLTLGLLIVGAIQAYIYWKQAGLMRGALIATKRSNVAAMKAAIATEESVNKSDAILKHSEKTASQELRAYLGIDTTSPTGIMAGIGIAGNVSANLYLKNFGQTPAYEVWDWMKIEISDFPLKYDLPLPVPDAHIHRGRSVVNPGQAITLMCKSDWVIEKRQLLDINGGKSAIYIYGSIHYRDVFGRPQSAKYRLYSRSTNSRSTDYEIHPEGNEAT